MNLANLNKVSDFLLKEFGLRVRSRQLLAKIISEAGSFKQLLKFKNLFIVTGCKTAKDLLKLIKEHKGFESVSIDQSVEYLAKRRNISIEEAENLLRRFKSVSRASS